ncbi:MAG: zinc-ribbon domain-containing protein, partial [bacterium]|nr:zinc-ribbon domain-containing protein [bacterium]
MKVTKTYNLLVIFPQIAKSWHPIKNGKLKPEYISPNSNKKIWWLCESDIEHEWQESPNHRNWLKTNCPFCIGSFPSNKNNLLFLYPNISAEWHYIKNNNKPEDFLPHSNKKVWWLCENNNAHEWEAVINDRVGKKSGCPFCSGRCADNCNNLAIDNPEIARQWHPTKNGNNKPENYLSGSDYKPWWICNKNIKHE